MPLTKYQLRSEYGLADPELYRAADKDDPEALLEGVAMAGLVGILRQLGDLAEFAAEMFHDLHEEVMATAARGHGLMVRVQQLEAEFPSIEKALLSQTDHSPFFSNTGVDWHPNVQLEQSLITRGDLPRCVMDSYEECRGPPRLFLLDKFDVAGAGACLKRYSDPSFFRLETLSSEGSFAEIQREKKSRKSKKRGSRCRNGGTPEISSTSHAKLHELFLEERVQGVHADPARLVKLKTRKLDGYLLISKSGESYMEKFVETCVDQKPDYGGIASNPELLTWNMDDARDSVTEVPEISMAVVVNRFCQGTEAEVSSPNEHENLPNYNLNGNFVDKVIETVPESTHDETEEIASTVSDRIVEKHLLTNLKGVSESLQDRKYSEDLTSEVDNYVDAPATMESETETDDDGRTRNRSGTFSVGEHDSNSDVDAEKMEDPPRYSDSQSVGNTSASENVRSSFLRWKSSFSYSDAASISTENDPSEREKTAEPIRSTDSCKNEPVELSSNVTRGSTDAHGSDSPEQELTDGSDVDHQASCTSLGTNSSPRFVSHNAESHASIVQSLAPEIVGASREFSKHDLKEGGRDESRTDPFDSSGAWLLVSSSEGNRCDTAIADTNITSCAVDYVSESLANSGTDYRKSDVSPTDRKLPCSASLEVESSTNDIGSKLCDPIAAADIHSDNSLDDEGVNVTTTKVVSSECSPTFGSSTDESVSDSREVTLVNVAVMSTEIIDNKGFHDDVRLDSETLEIESKEEPVVSGTDADAACGDVNHEASKCSPTSSDVSDITYKMASGAKELCNNNVLESDRTLLAECNPELEGNMQTIPFEGTDIDDKDLANGESTLPTSQNLIDADPETKSTHPGTILDNSIDSFLLDHQKPSETPLEHSMVLTDETILQSYVCKGFSSEFVPQSTVESNSSTQALNLESTFPRLSFIPDTAPPSLDEIPPLPPLPPVQWRLGKLQHFGSPSLSGESVEDIKSPLSASPPVDFGLDTQIGVAASPEFMQPISLEGGRLEQLPAESANNASDTPSLSHIQFPTVTTDSQHDSCGSPGSQSPRLHHDKPAACEDLNGDMSEHISPSSGDADQCPDTKALTPMKSTEAEENREAAEASNILVQKILPGSVGDAMWPVNAFAVAPTLDTEKPNEIPTVKLPRPRSPLVDAVAAHDRSTMRKVSERTRLPMESKEEDSNSFLAQIRNKSFNLKPAAMKRPNMKGGPKTNLKVAAILEKANTIRQAMAGSDEDDHDSDTWSDS